MQFPIYDKTELSDADQILNKLSEKGRNAHFLQVF